MAIVEVVPVAKPGRIHRPALERLPVCYQVLLSLAKEGREYVSSRELGGLTGFDHSQVRKDFNHFWSGGRPGRGYEISELVTELEDLLGLSSSTEAVIVGAGKLGTALCSYPGFAELGLKILAAFDNDPGKVGTTIGSVPVFDVIKLTGLVRRLGVRLGIITVPAEAAPVVAEAMVDGGIQAIWNFAPVVLPVPEEVMVRTEDLAVGLLTLSHYLKNKDKESRLSPAQ